ncbi:MAG: hypothetical protein M3505_13035 [Verrucomicrobiota bacterium]|nr:hypothetical protein [Verrucomicrobiota bacterium]
MRRETVETISSSKGTWIVSAGNSVCRPANISLERAAEMQAIDTFAAQLRAKERATRHPARPIECAGPK